MHPTFCSPCIRYQVTGHENQLFYLLNFGGPRGAQATPKSGLKNYQRYTGSNRWNAGLYFSSQQNVQLQQSWKLAGCRRDSPGVRTRLYPSGHVPQNWFLQRLQAPPISSGSAEFCSQTSGSWDSQDCPCLRPAAWPLGNLASSSDELSQVTTLTPGHPLPGHLFILSPPCSCTFRDPLTATSILSSIICDWLLLKDKGRILFIVIPPVPAQCPVSSRYDRSFVFLIKGAEENTFTEDMLSKAFREGYGFPTGRQFVLQATFSNVW